MTKASMNKMNIRMVLLGIAAMVTVVACKKEYDAPPVRTLPSGDILTIADLKAMYLGTSITFEEPKSVFATVTTDETDGNFYKNVTVQDATGGITLRLINSGGLYIGDSIRIYLPGIVLEPYNNLMQLTNVDVDNNIVKQATQRYVQPRVTTIPDLTANIGAWQSTLIRLENVQFVAAEAGVTTWSTPGGTSSVDRHLEDCVGNQVVIRNSPYSNYAADTLPVGKGSIVASVGIFGMNIQLGAQSISGVQLTGPRCGESGCLPEASLNESFNLAVNNTDLTLECWLNTFTLGTRKWKGGVSGPDSYAEAKPSSFDGAVETWLITTPIGYTPGMALNFKSALGSAWQHDGLSVLVTTDINLNDGGDVANATWTPVTGATLATNGTTVATWIPSGPVGLNPFLTAGDNFRIGFKYVGSGSGGQATPYRIDDVTIQ